jgi:acyl-CoA synthetase (AMP-forming)/AMP-acid ligase II
MERVAGALHALGVEQGDRVGIFAHNGLDYVLAMFGAWRLGAISVLINVSYAERLNYYLADAKPKVLIYTGDKQADIERVRHHQPSIQHYICFDGKREGTWSWSELLAGASPAPSGPRREDDIAHLSYTSGTSGDPKGACLAHEPTLRAARCIAERLRVDGDDIGVGPTTLASSYHLMVNLLPLLYRQAQVALMTRWQKDHGWELLDAAATTVLTGNPVILQDVLDVSRERGRVPGRLRLGVSGGAPSPPDLKRSWRDELRTTLAESYGQSELGGFVGLGTTDLPSEAKLAACGRPLPDKEVRVLDEDDKEVPVGTTGEICIRGGFMAGYWQRPEQTNRVLRGGWLHTGDAGFMDAEQFVHMRGRISERIRIAGVNWYPRDVEEKLQRHPRIGQVALIGVPDGERDVRPVAYVTTDGEYLDTEEVLSFIRAGLDPVPPALIIRVITEMPMTPTGKISRAELETRSRLTQ